MSRRKFAALLSLAAGAAPLARLGAQSVSDGLWSTANALPGDAPSATPNATRSPTRNATPRPGARPAIGVQLYTVRRLMQEDLPGTLASLSAMGVREVEFAGYFNYTPVALRALLREHALTAPAAHVGVPANWEPVFDAAEAMGHQWVVVPWVGPEVRESAGSWQRFADQLNEAGQRAAGRPFRMGYHNHDFEFDRVGGRLAFDILLERLDPALVDLELDLYWAVKSGQDPAAWFARYPGRFPLWHLKDAGPAPERTMQDVGLGTINFAALFQLADAAGLQHAFVEHDNPADPLASVQRSVAALSAMP